MSLSTVLHNSFAKRTDASALVSSSGIKREISLDYIDTYCRIRPSQNQKNDTSPLYVDTKDNYISLRKDGKIDQYHFLKVFDKLENQNIGRFLAVEIMENVMYERKNIVFFNYGTKNSGKTFSTIGTSKEPGMLRCLLKMIKSDIDIQAIEILNNRPFSLSVQKQDLSRSESPFLQKNKIRKCNNSNILDDLLEHRSTFNCVNSLSHAVFKIYFSTRTITIFDLAGGQVSNDSPGMSMSLNKDLVNLKDFLDQSFDSGNSYLTKLIKSQVQDNCKIIMLINIFQNSQLLSETQKVLTNALQFKNYDPSFGNLPLNFKEEKHDIFSPSSNKITNNSNPQTNILKFLKLQEDQNEHQNDFSPNIIEPWTNIHEFSPFYKKTLSFLDNAFEEQIQEQRVLMRSMLSEIHIGIEIEVSQDSEIQNFRSSFKSLVDMSQNPSNLGIQSINSLQKTLLDRLSGLYQSTNKTIQELRSLKQEKGLIEDLIIRENHYKQHLNKNQEEIYVLTTHLSDYKRAFQLYSKKHELKDAACSPFKMLNEKLDKTTSTEQIITKNQSIGIQTQQSEQELKLQTISSKSFVQNNQEAKKETILQTNKIIPNQQEKIQIKFNQENTVNNSDNKKSIVQSIQEKEPVKSQVQQDLPKQKPKRKKKQRQISKQMDTSQLDSSSIAVSNSPNNSVLKDFGDLQEQKNSKKTNNRRKKTKNIISKVSLSSCDSQKKNDESQNRQQCPFKIPDNHKNNNFSKYSQSCKSSIVENDGMEQKNGPKQVSDQQKDNRGKKGKKVSFSKQILDEITYHQADLSKPRINTNKKKRSAKGQSRSKNNKNT